MTARAIGLLLIAFFVSRGVKAQGPVDVEIRQSSANEQIISHILKITNRSEQSFNGSVRIGLPSGIRTLSRDETEIYVVPGDSSFAAYKLLVGGDVEAGRKTVRYDIYNEKREKVLSREAPIDIAHREQLFLLGNDAPVMVINPEDSVRIAVTVNNSGNTYEEVTVVFNVPNLRGRPPFTELKGTVAPMERKRFTLSFIPSGNLLRSEQFSVQATAMKGKEKTIFGSKAFTVQNVFTDRNFVDTDPARVLYSGQGFDGNSVTLSYRQYGPSSNMVQLQGGGYLNLPAGYLHLKGNIYQYSSQRTPMVTNTSLMYKLYENEFTIGNVNEQTELPLYGRGAKAMFSDRKKNKTLTVGAIDQNFNLAGPEPWFSDYYSFYAQGALGANNT